MKRFRGEFLKRSKDARCFKITEKSPFNIANYILSGQKHFDQFSKKSVTRQVTFNRTKIGGECQNWKNSNETFWVIFKHCEMAKLLDIESSSTTSSISAFYMEEQGHGFLIKHFLFCFSKAKEDDTRKKQRLVFLVVSSKRSILTLIAFKIVSTSSSSFKSEIPLGRRE